MKKRASPFYLVMALIGIILVGNCSKDEEGNPVGPETAPPDTARTLSVQVNYTGMGAVGPANRIYCVVSDNSALVSNANSRLDYLESASGTLTFNNMYSPCYVAVFYDKDGNEDFSNTDRYLIYNYKPFSGTYDSVSIAEGDTTTLSFPFHDNFIRGGAVKVTVNYTGGDNISASSPIRAALYPDNNLTLGGHLNMLASSNTSATFIIDGLTNASPVYLRVFSDFDGNGEFGDSWEYHEVYTNMASWSKAIAVPISVPADRMTNIGTVEFDDTFGGA